MFRHQFFNIIFVLLVGIFTSSCKTETENTSPNFEFKKGAYISDPVFVNKLNTITIIEAQSWDDSLKTLSRKQDLRPANLLYYGPYINANRIYGTKLANLDQSLYSYYNSNSNNQFVIAKSPQQVKLTLSWNKIIDINKQSNNRLVVAIFKNLIKVSPITNDILNKEDIVWMGFDPKTIDRIDFLDGKMVEYNQKTQKLVKTYTPKISDLQPGVYVWAVWAYNNNGTQIVASSREIPFSVVNL